MHKIGKFGPAVFWYPADNVSVRTRLHDPGKPAPRPGVPVVVEKGAVPDLDTYHSAGWVRTWAELNRAVILWKPATLPKWHVLEGSLPYNLLPDSAVWCTGENNGLSAWARWGVSLGSASPDRQWVEQLRHWSAKRQPYKNGWDQTFYFTSPEPVREVFALSSSCQDRTVLAFDTNGAFSYAVAHVNVPDAARLRKVEGADLVSSWADSSVAGVYRVLIETTPQTPDWWYEYHPLVVRNGKTALPCRWPEGPVETFIHACEKEIWARFVTLTPLDGIVATGTPHALCSTARSLWRQRCEALEPTEKGCLKWLLSRLHTATTPSLELPCTDQDLASWEALNCCPGQLTSIPDIGHATCQWSSAATIFAHSRKNWLSFISAVLSACPESIPAYSNVDSLHFIVPTARVPALLQTLQQQGLVGADWGQWRLQATGSKAVWLGLGKYWIVGEDNELRLHQNLGNKNPWATAKRWPRPFQNKQGEPYTVGKITQTIWDTLSDHKVLNSAVAGVHTYRRPDYALVMDQAQYSTHCIEQRLRSRQKTKYIWYAIRNAVLE